MNLSLAKRIILCFVLVLALLLLVGLVGYTNSHLLLRSTERVAHTHQVLASLAEVYSKVQALLITERSYLITGDEKLTATMAGLSAAAGTAVEEVRQLTLDNPVQQQNVKTLQVRVAEAVAYYNESVRGRRDRGDTEARLIVATGQGPLRLEAVRAVITEMNTEEERLLAARTLASRHSVSEASGIVLLSVGLATLLVIAAGTWLTRSITQPIGQLVEGARNIGGGKLEHRVVISRIAELGELGRAFNQMAAKIQDNNEAQTALNWSKTNQAQIYQLVQGRRDLAGVTRDVLSTLAPLVHGLHAVFYLRDPERPGVLRLHGSYGYTERKNLSQEFKEGEGLVGQCLRERQRILISEAPEDYVRIRSGLGEAKPVNIVVLPIAFENEVLGVIELASFQKFTQSHLEFLSQVSEGLGIALAAIAASARTDDLLKQSQTMAHELQAQQEELRAANEVLEQKNRQLTTSEEELRQAEEEQRVLNEELTEKAGLLEQQNRAVELKNREVERARAILQEKSEELASTSRYKTEFLANMSHELRTPLNSLLILSQLLSENGGGNLTEKQVEQARTIHHSGQDLLDLINEILDLSKIESGTVQPDVEPVSLSRVVDFAEQQFRHVAESRQLTFEIRQDPALPPQLQTDERRLKQILKNLLANAFKFTERGSVSLYIAPASHGWGEGHPSLNTTDPVIAFTVSDTGVGIPEDKLQVIFEAFRQADGATARKFGGTGLGLSISRGLAELLGGTIRVESEIGRGSVFTLYLPAGLVVAPKPDANETLKTPQKSGHRGIRPKAVRSNTPNEVVEAWTETANRTGSRRSSKRDSGDVGSSLSPSSTSSSESSTTPEAMAEREHEPESFDDDRHNIARGDQTLLVIEDDPEFAKIVKGLAQERGFKVIQATNGRQALELARQYRPSAISLDLGLPEGDGWVVLDRLKHNSATSHIPVHIISGLEEEQRGLKQGALAYLQKPVTKESLQRALGTLQDFVRTGVRQLLLVEDNSTMRDTVLGLIGNGDVETTVVGSGEEALTLLAEKHFDCMVLDLKLPGMTGFQVLEKMRTEPGLANVPVVVYTGRDLSEAEEAQLARLSEAVILKGTHSPERLLDETALFLHRVHSRLPAAQRQLLDSIRASDPLLAGKRVLIVDDDMRNVFTLTALLERHNMIVQNATNGPAALEWLEHSDEVDVILMDIMMPEMDGYETTRRIRAISRFEKIPIIAVTAKAMKGDREKCLEAGASDYVAKPVEIEQLLSLLRVWLYN